MAQKRENVLRKIQQNENKMQEANQQKELKRQQIIQMRDMKMKEILLQKNNIVFESQIKRLKSFKERATKIQDAVQLQKETIKSKQQTIHSKNQEMLESKQHFLDQLTQAQQRQLEDKASKLQSKQT